ncbi:hypothetical protein [Bosea vaviloviae]|uniref:hypothetical protein n=1 Tax=Bosea vaviloviae TaxID=1526658 RepID=UPI0013147E3B|nr:hypothetical protein [Bosea vaviloviae]
MPFLLTSDSAPLTDVALLNDGIVPLILKHLDQWYYRWLLPARSEEARCPRPQR